MLIRLGLGAAALALLCGCKPSPPEREPERNAAAPAAGPSAAASAAPAANGSPLGQWLVGTWSFEADCATDFTVHYGADGALDNSGHTGRWSIEGSKVTETVTERPDESGEGRIKVDPPEVNIYSVTRSDPNHGVIAFQGRNVPILRC